MILLAKLSKYTFGLIIVAFILNACKPKTIHLKSPPGYNFRTADSKSLDTRLREISGIVWDRKRDVFIAEGDEEGVIYFLNRETKSILNSYKFGENGDYEDIALIDTIPYLLRSDGTIFKLNGDPVTGFKGTELGKLELSGENEFESLYYDPGRKALVMICKKCAMDEGKKVSAFAYYVDSIGFDHKPIFQLDQEAIKKLAPLKADVFQPSAAAIQPKQQKLYILSSLTRQLAVADLNGNVEGVYGLAPKLFPQAEGICFKKEGEMFISNEGGKGRSNIIYFQPDTTGTGTTTQKDNYDISKPDDKMVLGKQLHEISGMAWIPENNMILAENDEKGDIYPVDFKNKKDDFKKIKFGGHGDYEDIVHTDDANYLLVSSGSIIQVTIKDSVVTGTKEYALDKKGANEYETLYLDKADNSLIMLCKKCSHEKETSRSAFRFDLATKKFSDQPAYTIDIGVIQKMLNDNNAEFKPSAAAINPVTGKLFVVASVGKLLVITDKKGNVEKVFRLDPNLFNQPEGITFAPNGDLYISNEGGEGDATILKFSYRK